MRFEVMGAGPASEPRFLYAILAGALLLPAVIAVALHPQGDSLSRPLLFAFLLIDLGLIGLVLRSRAAKRPPEPVPHAEPGAIGTRTGEVEPEIDAVNRLGLSLAGRLDTASLVKAVADAGVAVTGAAYSAFLFKDASGCAMQYVAGAPKDTILDFSLFDDANAFGSPFVGAVSRTDDLAKDARYGPNLPFRRMPKGSLPAKSYLAAPVRARTGELLGGLFLGHPGASRFTERDERMVAALAAHAAIALDNAHLSHEAKQARASAEAANGLKDEFLATLSHELRTPLTAIVGWAYLLRGGKLSPDETARAVETIIRNAAAQNQIINELLDVSRIITGKVQLDLRPLDLATPVRSALNTITPAANAKGVHLQITEDSLGGFVMGDPERLQQAFWNLFSNAVKFTPKNGRVRISVEPVGSNVEVVVADSGLGIAPAFLPHIFDRFTQDDASSTRKSRGLGLGLSIVRHLVELHGGSVSAESPGLGQGATFTARFPRSTLLAAEPEPEIRKPAVSAPLGQEPLKDLTGVRVLVVEDDEDARGLIEKVLETQGASTRIVPSAREALQVLDGERFDVLLSDIEMAGTDGYELIKELRLRPNQRGGSLPAAALTAHARSEDRLRALRAGFQLHLPKPVQPSELVTVVASLAARRNL